ncbi:glycoside hydrolase family 3 C-terminal domain-containing protein [Paenibacillus sp. MMS20-IR301]|uniref:glycoside hydrolase family 3 C-terminal domain-containing protein n=1 Tax=Paenibacillus sp. MMS20-IR301 TaxID=2895946 RepID=UPI0028EF8255|nr:glycoside hydrolase family 3 C-terminal domain-containing protein [Paenibacillus sp. MMS20-IR301]WNS40810.1 glycoside hydrolase family 3 C-terminal domain-containing protein [Paenibacillus sp. MMS20-IR301]
MSKRRTTPLRKRLSVLGLILVLTCSLLPAIPPAYATAAENETLSFQRDATNKPIFDGVSEHLDAFVNLILSDMSNEDLVYYADQKSAGKARTIAAGYQLPGTAAGGVDRVMGVSTDLPSMLGLGQSWNKDLVNKVGTIIGDERRGEVDATDPNTLMFSAVSDLRTNPLSGRYEEGYAEDPVLAGTMVNAMAEGITGYGEEGNEDGFWLKAQLGTKHYTNYIAQWFRQSGQFYASARALNEYQNKSFLEPLQAGLVQSLMTTYGRTNGVPNHISPNIIRASNANPYSMMPVGDFIFADRNMTAGFNNGYQNYTDADGAAALLLLSGNHANTSGSSQASISNAVNNGTFGVTRIELENSVRGQIEMWVRSGHFNEKNADGSPVMYPFTDLAKDHTPQNYTKTESQAVALDAARESVVLLKNDGVLPLSKSSKLAVTGLLADTRFKATYSVGKTPALPNAGLSPLGAIREVIGSNQVTYGTGAPVIAFESVANHKTVTGVTYTEGAQLRTSFTAPTALTVTDNVYSTVTANVYAYQSGGKLYTTSQAFEAYDWGQQAYSYLSLANGKWIKDVTNGSNRTVQNTDATKLNLVENPFSNVSDASTMPGRFRNEVNPDGTVSLIAGSYSESFTGGFETVYYTGGRLVTVNNSDGLDLSATTLTNKATAAIRSDNQKFNEITLKEAGADAQVWAANNDYAVVVVGTAARHSAGEGADRSDLNLGDDQYRIVSKVAESFPKKTIVIVKANAPVNMEEIQSNGNVAAILYQPYAGQYDSKALAEVLFGDYAPSGRLSSTWYAGMESFPKLDKYSLPEGMSTSVADIDPRFTVDMSNGDPMDSKMTYMYTDADVTYPFGYGLSYSSFSYDNLNVPVSASGSEPFEVTVNVTNTGNVDTAEVIQLYIKNNTSAYGEHTPKKQLVSYEKVEIAAGKTKTVRLTVDPADFRVWNVNSNDYVAESGLYSLSAGESSQNLPLQAELSYTGGSIAALNASTPVNVFDHAFASSEMVYREVSKLRTAEGLKAKLSENGYYGVMSKGNGSWVALNQVDLTGATGVTLRGASINPASVIELRADSPTGKRLAVMTFEQTEPETRDVPGSSFKVIELGYKVITEELLAASSGTHDLYLVFKNADMRVDSIQLVGATPEVVKPSATGQINKVALTWPAATGAVSYNLYLKNADTYTPVTENVTWNADGLGATVSGLADHTAYTFAVTAVNNYGESAYADVNATTEQAGGGETPPTPTPTPVPTPAPTSEPSSGQPAGTATATPVTTGQAVATATAIPSPTGAPSPTTAAFQDVGSKYDWAKEAINALSAAGIIQGTSKTSFEPAKPVTRADFVLLLVRAFNLSSDTQGKFADVKDNTYYAEALGIAKGLGITNGDARGNFNPKADISRQDMMVLIMRTLKVMGKSDFAGTAGDLAAFKDASQVKDYAINDVAALVKAGIVKGDGQSLNPKGRASRAEAAVILYRIYQLQ